MTFKTPYLLSGAVAMSMLATTASVWAQSSAPPVVAGPAAAPQSAAAKEMPAAFVKADANKDGKLSKQEAKVVPGLAAKFDDVDTDQDKMVSSTEFEKFLP